MHQSNIDDGMMVPSYVNEKSRQAVQWPTRDLHLFTGTQKFPWSGEQSRIDDTSDRSYLAVINRYRSTARSHNPNHTWHFDNSMAI